MPVRPLLFSVFVGAAVLASVGGVAFAASGAPRKAFKPADLALARSIVLRRSDLPAGFKASPSSGSQAEAPRCKGFKPNESDLTLRGRASSPDFDTSGNPPLISSSADVWLNAAQAQADFARVVRRGLDACLFTLFGQGLTASAAKGVKYLPVTHSLKPLAGLGQQATTVRLVFTGVSGNSRTAVIADFIAIRKDRVTALVTALNLRTPYPKTHQLAAIVASRIP